ncbi:MAG TPA: hypothetical protein V6C82_06955 [Chroococcales cyanobacterium]
MKLRITENNYKVRVEGLMRVGYTREKAEEIATSEFSPPQVKPKKPAAAKKDKGKEDKGKEDAPPKLRGKGPATKLKSGILQEDGTVSWDAPPQK